MEAGSPAAMVAAAAAAGAVTAALAAVPLVAPALAAPLLVEQAATPRPAVGTVAAGATPVAVALAATAATETAAPALLEAAEAALLLAEAAEPEPALADAAAAAGVAVQALAPLAMPALRHQLPLLRLSSAVEAAGTLSPASKLPMMTISRQWSQYLRQPKCGLLSLPQLALKSGDVALQRLSPSRRRAGHRRPPQRGETPSLRAALLRPPLDVARPSSGWKRFSAPSPPTPSMSSPGVRISSRWSSGGTIGAMRLKKSTLKSSVWTGRGTLAPGTTLAQRQRPPALRWDRLAAPPLPERAQTWQSRRELHWRPLASLRFTYLSGRA